jgi:hypothetical protein
MEPRPDTDSELQQRFARAVATLAERFATEHTVMADENQDATVRNWLDADRTLPWTGEGVTADEWFFITTLYGEMTLEGQRTHIRTFFPQFMKGTGGDIRAITPELVGNWKLRSRWMKSRLCRMAEILNQRQISMADYVASLRQLERGARPDNPMPALDAIATDHRASGWKTLSVFVRDCVGGNCFPIDSRVEKELNRWGLPADERLIVGLSLTMNRNARQIARMFYAAGGE